MLVHSQRRSNRSSTDAIPTHQQETSVEECRSRRGSRRNIIQEETQCSNIRNNDDAAVSTSQQWLGTSRERSVGGVSTALVRTLGVLLSRLRQAIRERGRFFPAPPNRLPPSSRGDGTENVVLQIVSPPIDQSRAIEGAFAFQAAQGTIGTHAKQPPNRAQWNLKSNIRIIQEISWVHCLL